MLDAMTIIKAKLFVLRLAQSKCNVNLGLRMKIIMYTYV